MKQVLLITFLLLGLMLPMKASAAPGTPTVTLPMQKSPGNGNGNGNGNGGGIGGGVDDDDTDKRIPSARVQCTIDFENGTITGNFSSDLLAYEVWDEEGEECIAMFADASGLVSFLYSADGGLYQLRFYSDSYIYIGYISFE